MDLVCDELGGGRETSAGSFLLHWPVCWTAVAGQLGKAEGFLSVFLATWSSNPARPGHTRGMTPAFLLMIEFKVANYSDSLEAGGLLLTLTLKDLHVRASVHTHYFMDV